MSLYGENATTLAPPGAAHLPPIEVLSPAETIEEFGKEKPRIDCEVVPENASDHHGMAQRPAEFKSLTEEIFFIVICSMGQLLFATYVAQAFVNQLTFVSALKIGSSLTPWLLGSFMVANGVSVIVSGSIADPAGS